MIPSPSRVSMYISRQSAGGGINDGTAAGLASLFLSIKLIPGDQLLFIFP